MADPSPESSSQLTRPTGHVGIRQAREAGSAGSALRAVPSPQSTWDRRSHYDRRKRQRRCLYKQVGLERRARADRRRNKRCGRRKTPSYALQRLPRESVQRLGGLRHVLETGLLGRAQVAPPSHVVVHVRHGLAASVCSAWELCPKPIADGAEYTTDSGRTRRKIGSSLLGIDVLSSIERADEVYESQYQRAYRAVYAAFPLLQGVAQERFGQIIVRAPLNSLLMVEHGAAPR